MKQKTYNCNLRFKGDILHQLPLQGVTRHELQFLAFLHGADAIADVRFAGESEVFMPLAEGATEPQLVANEMGEFKRLALKYDDIVNPGRGKKAVEACFHTRIDDFDAIVTEVDARESALAAADRAEAEAAIATGGAGHAVVEKQLEEATVKVGVPPVGQRVFSQARQ